MKIAIPIAILQAKKIMPVENDQEGILLALHLQRSVVQEL